MAKGRKPIHLDPSNKALLHKDLYVPADKKIPAKTLSEALESKSPAVKKRAQFAKNAKSWKHK